LKGPTLRPTPAMAYGMTPDQSSRGVGSEQ